MSAIKTPGSVNTQSGDTGGSSRRVRTGVRSGGSNQGKVTGASRRYSAHPRMKGQ